MSDVKQAAPEGQETAPSSLLWSDVEVARAWISGLREHVEEAKAATEDQMLPHRQRRLGHLAAERILQDTFKAIDKALSYAEHGFPPSA
jgi:hypothetical protein